jgi:hypothetical protein
VLLDGHLGRVRRCERILQRVKRFDDARGQHALESGLGVRGDSAERCEQDS